MRQSMMNAQRPRTDGEEAKSGAGSRHSSTALRRSAADGGGPHRDHRKRRVFRKDAEATGHPRRRSSACRTEGARGGEASMAIAARRRRADCAEVRMDTLSEGGVRLLAVFARGEWMPQVDQYYEAIQARIWTSVRGTPRSYGPAPGQLGRRAPTSGGALYRRLSLSAWEVSWSALPSLRAVHDERGPVDLIAPRRSTGPLRKPTDE